MKKLIHLAAIVIFIASCSSLESKQQNNAKISRITFENGECTGKCQSFQLQIDSSKRILYNGLTSVEKKGYFIGTINQQFWNDLVDKTHAVNLKQIKSQYGEYSKNEQPLKLRLETDKGTYQSRITDSTQAPASLLKLVYYILNNYKNIEMKPLDLDSIFKSNVNPRRKMFNQVLEKIPC